MRAYGGVLSAVPHLPSWPFVAHLAAGPPPDCACSGAHAPSAPVVAQTTAVPRTRSPFVTVNAWAPALAASVTVALPAASVVTVWPAPVIVAPADGAGVVVLMKSGAEPNVTVYSSACSVTLAPGGAVAGPASSSGSPEKQVGVSALLHDGATRTRSPGESSCVQMPMLAGASFT